MQYPNSKFGPYELVKRLGVGGMAETFLAIKRGLGGFEQKVCLKKILPGYEQDSEFVDLFLEEARLSATLRHTNIAQVLDFGVMDETHFLCLELVDGMDLRALLRHLKKQGVTLDPGLAAHIAYEISCALDFAHRADESGAVQGVVHRDISPSNILLSEAGEVKLTDFGIAKAMNQPSLTRTGVVKGKVAYMAPEYANLGHFDARSDLFSLGVSIYECLTGKRPFIGQTEAETLLRISRGQYAPIQELSPHVPESFIAVIDGLLEPEPTNRFQNANQFVDMLMVHFPPPLNCRRALGNLIRECNSRPKKPTPLSRTPSSTFKQHSEQTMRSPKPASVQSKDSNPNSTAQSPTAIETVSASVLATDGKIEQPPQPQSHSAQNLPRRDQNVQQQTPHVEVQAPTITATAIQEDNVQLPPNNQHTVRDAPAMITSNALNAPHEFGNTQTTQTPKPIEPNLDPRAPNPPTLLDLEKIQIQSDEKTRTHTLPTPSKPALSSPQVTTTQKSVSAQNNPVSELSEDSDLNAPLPSGSLLENFEAFKTNPKPNPSSTSSNPRPSSSSIQNSTPKGRTEKPTWVMPSRRSWFKYLPYSLGLLIPFIFYFVFSEILFSSPSQETTHLQSITEEAPIPPKPNLEKTGNSPTQKNPAATTPTVSKDTAAALTKEIEITSQPQQVSSQAENPIAPKPNTAFVNTPGVTQQMSLGINPEVQTPSDESFPNEERTKQPSPKPIVEKAPQKLKKRMPKPLKSKATPIKKPKKKPKVQSNEPATLSIVIIPFGKVWIDGKFVGQSPLLKTVPPGTHTVGTGDKKPTQTKKIHVKGGETQKVYFSLH